MALAIVMMGMGWGPCVSCMYDKVNEDCTSVLLEWVFYRTWIRIQDAVKGCGRMILWNFYEFVMFKWVGAWHLSFIMELVFESLCDGRVEIKTSVQGVV